MCLEKVEKPIKKWGVGYKSVNKMFERYYSYDCIEKAGFQYQPIGVWGRDPNTKRIKAGDGTFYEPGFHISLRNDNIQHPPIIKVRFRKATAGQLNDPIYGTTVVAKEMMIIEELSNGKITDTNM